MSKADALFVLGIFGLAGACLYQTARRAPPMSTTRYSKARQAPDDTPVDDLLPGDLLAGDTWLACDPEGGLTRLSEHVIILHGEDQTLSISHPVCPAPGRARWQLTHSVWERLE